MLGGSGGAFQSFGMPLTNTNANANGVKEENNPARGLTDKEIDERVRLAVSPIPSPMS